MRFREKFCASLLAALMGTALPGNVLGEPANSTSGKTLHSDDNPAPDVDPSWYDVVRQDILTAYLSDNQADSQNDDDENQRKAPALFQNRSLVGASSVFSLMLGGALGTVLGRKDGCKSRTNPRCSNVQSPSS